MSEIRVSYIGHATFLIQMGQDFILTDPHFSKKALFRQRLQAPGIHPNELPPLKAILITNAHYDHLDLFSFKYFSIHTPIVAPLGLGKFLRRFLPNPIIELPPWSEHPFLDGLKLYSLPVKHRGYRFSHLTLRQTTGYLIEKNQKTVYFPGTTAYGEHFRQISHVHAIDVALLPIGHFKPRFFRRSQQMNPLEAITALKDLKAKVAIPYYFGVFNSWSEEPALAIDWLNRLLQDDPTLPVKVLDPGQSFSVGSKPDELYLPGSPLLPGSIS